MNASIASLRLPFTSLIVLLLLASMGCRASQVGMEAFNKGDYVRSRDYLYEAIKQEPDKAAEITPFYIRSVLKISEEHMAAGRFEKALLELDKAREIVRDEPQLRAMRIKVLLAFAEVCLKDGNLEITQANATEVLRIDPANAEARRLRGRIAIQTAQRDVNTGRYDDALARYREYLRDFPTDMQIRREAADVHVARGQDFHRKRQYKEAITAYAGALNFIPEYQPALKGGLESAGAAGGGLSANYIFLVDQAPEDPGLRRLVVDQLRRRAEDLLDQGDVNRSSDFIQTAYKLDRQSEAHLMEYERLVNKLVSLQFDRGEARAAASTLQQMGHAMPPLRSSLDERANRMVEEEQNFFIALEDNLALINTVISEARVALSSGETLTDAQRQQLSVMMNYLNDQRETLMNVRRTKNRQLLDRRVFRVQFEVTEVLYNVLGKPRYNRYRQLIEDYRGTSTR